jgi:hypothetical protein
MAHMRDRDGRVGDGGFQKVGNFPSYGLCLWSGSNYPIFQVGTLILHVKKAVGGSKDRGVRTSCRWTINLPACELILGPERGAGVWCIKEVGFVSVRVKVLDGWNKQGKVWVVDMSAAAGVTRHEGGVAKKQCPALLNVFWWAGAVRRDPGGERTRFRPSESHE